MRRRGVQGGGVTTYIQVVRRPEMAAVLVAHAMSLVGSVAAEVALSVLVYRRTSSSFLAAMTLACAFVPQGASALLLSSYVARFRPRRLLVGCDLVCAGLVAAMLVPGVPVVVLLALAAGTGLVTPLFTGARAAVLADLLDASAFVTARSLLRVLSQSALLLGFAAGGLALAVVGPEQLLAADAVSFLASAVLLRWGTGDHPPPAPGTRPPLSQSLRVTGRSLRDPVLRRLLLLTWIPAALFCPVDAIATPYAHGRGREVGLLLAAAAAGTIAAEWLGVRAGLSRRPRLVLPVALVTGLALLGYAGHPPVLVAAAPEPGGRARRRDRPVGGPGSRGAPAPAGARPPLRAAGRTADGRAGPRRGRRRSARRGRRTAPGARRRGRAEPAVRLVAAARRRHRATAPDGRIPGPETGHRGLRATYALAVAAARLASNRRGVRPTPRVSRAPWHTCSSGVPPTQGQPAAGCFVVGGRGRDPATVPF